MYDVIIVGAGSAGSYLAYRLASSGYKVALLEKKRRIGEAVCCTGIIGRECVEHFPIFDNLIAREARSASFFSPSGELLRIAKEESQAYIIWRPALDHALADRAQKEGAEYFLAHRVNGIRLEDDCIVADVQWSRKEKSFHARVAVIASGFGSDLPLRLGLGSIGDFASGAQIEVAAAGLDEVEVYLGQEVAPGFFAWLVPTSEGKALAGLLTRGNPGRYLKKFVSELSVRGKISPPTTEISYGGIPLRPLSRTYGERVLVVGDAAGQVKPTTGGGIYYGLLCAEIAAEVLYQALSTADFSAKQLSHYEREWKDKLSRELRIGYYARKFYEKLNDKQVERAFDIVKSNGIHQAILETEGFSFDWHGDLILRLLKHHALSALIPGVIKNWRPR